MNGGCAVLLYHRVENLNTDPQLLAVSPENFRSHINFLVKNYNVLSPDKFRQHITSEKRFPEKSVLITFDDGYADNLHHAIPVLESYQCQALFYISTSLLNTDEEFWWDEVERIILLSPTLPNTLKLKIVNDEIVFRTGSPPERRMTYEMLLPLLRKQAVQSRKEALGELRKWSGNMSHRSSHRSLKNSELIELSDSSSATIGAHTHNHQSLAHLTRDEQMKEIATSKDILERLTKKKIIDFSYPFGTRQDFSGTTKEICRQMQFELVAANFPRIANHKSDPFAFPRFLIRNWKVEEFSGQLKNFWSR